MNQRRKPNPMKSQQLSCHMFLPPFSTVLKEWVLERKSFEGKEKLKIRSSGGGGKVSYNIIFLKWLHIPGRKRRGEEEGKEVEEEKNFFKKSFVSLPLTFAYF